MDKEAQEKIAEMLCRCGDDSLLDKPPERYILADRIIQTMKELGYRKPKGKPPLLKPWQIDKAILDAHSTNSDKYDEIAQAQWNICIKYYED